MPDKYAFHVTNKRTNGRTDGQTEGHRHCVSPSFVAGTQFTTAFLPSVHDCWRNSSLFCRLSIFLSMANRKVETCFRSVTEVDNDVKITIILFTIYTMVAGASNPHPGWEINPPHLTRWSTLHLVWTEHEGTILFFGPVWFGCGNLEAAP